MRPVAPKPDTVPSTGAANAEAFDRIGDYELLELIGSGGMGRVFKAHQVSLNRIVALKILPPALARNQTYTLRFLREARASGKLTHPNVVQGIDCAQDEGSGLWYFAMEYIDGHSLSDELKRCRALPEDRVIEIGMAIASALEVAAQNGIVHRDIKPENILVSNAGEIKLADLGVAKLSQDEDASLTRADDMVGTPYYVPPEQARGKRDQIDTRSDIYALGGTLFHLVTGQPPYEGETCTDIMMKHIQDKVPSARRVDPSISEAFSRAIAKMMQKMPVQRYQTPTELREALERAKLGIFIGRGETTSVDPVPQHPAPRHAPSRSSSSKLRRGSFSGRSRSYLVGGIAAILCSIILLICLIPGVTEDPVPTKARGVPVPSLLPPAHGVAPVAPAVLPVPSDAPSSATAGDVKPTSVDRQVLRGRFVRIELTGEGRALCLAEVEVFSGTENVALKGKAVQSSLAFGGTPDRAIDGRTDGVFFRGSISHTSFSRSPHWEVDLGGEYAIDRIVVWTRTDEGGRYAIRLADFSMIILSGERSCVCRVDRVPAPSLKCTLQPVFEAGKPVRLAWAMPPNAPAVPPSKGLALGTGVPGLDGWQHGDIGAVEAAGSAQVDNDTITLKPSGADIYNQTDEGLFVYRCLRGDGSLTVHVQSIAKTDLWSKVGVMFRESLTGDARNAYMFVAANNTRVLTYRATKGAGTAGCPHGPATPLPCWLRLTREGDSFTGYYSDDGTKWTRLGSITIAMGKDVFACLAATSHLDGSIATIVVDSFTFEGTPTPPDEWPAPPSSP